MAKRRQDDVNAPLENIEINASFATTFGLRCARAIEAIAKLSDVQFSVTFNLDPACLQLQVQHLVSQVTVTGQMGTGDGMPCHVTRPLTDDDGNWDFAMAILMRIVACKI
ncbi:hypothetical protein NKI74_34535 [Mesorhizobium sp. M0494]|uniref:hypothetical protein n=1 Tax=Mesorhizobium sp. M0494 TaxID=2956951 RepID=UPI003338A15E